MKIYGNMTLSEGSDIKNMTAPQGASYPNEANVAEIFYHSTNGLSVYTGSIWETINTNEQLLTNSKIISGLGFTPVNKAGDTLTGNLGMPASSGAGITIGDAFSYGWRDLIGDVAGKSSGTGAPQQKYLFPSAIRAWAYYASDQGDLLFHIPHDYAPGTDMFLHFHWTHNGTNISGNFIIDCKVTYAKGHQQMSFVSPVVAQVNLTGLSINNTPTFMHRVDEIPLSTNGGSSSTLNTQQIEVDGVIAISFITSTIPAISGSSTSVNTPFILSADLHYQSTGLSTKNKSPNFYG